MAPPELREALGELCGGGGGGGEWSYAVFWRADRRDPGLLIVEDSYYEDQVGGMVGKMINHFHIIGEGIIGEALVSGKCRWMYADTDGTGLSQTNPIASQEIFQGNTWWQHQFLEGIKTIAVIPLPSFGVVQFGSTRKVPESSEFINKVQDLLKQLGSMSVFLNNGSYKDIITYNQPAALGCASSLGDIFKCYNSTSSLQSKTDIDKISHTQLLRPPFLSSADFSKGSFNAFGCYGSGSSINSYMSSYIGLSKGYLNFGNFSYQANNQSHPVNAETHAQLASRTLPSSIFSHNKTSTYLNTPGISELTNPPMMGERLSSGMGMQGFASVTSLNDFPCLGVSSSSCSAFGSCNTISSTRSQINEACLPSIEKLLDFQNSSICSYSIGNLSGAESLDKIPSFTPEIPNTCLTLSEVLIPEKSLLFPANESATNFASQMNETLLDVASVSAGLVQTKGNGCIEVISSKLTEDPTACVFNSLGRGSNENTSTAPTQQAADNDLYNDMVFELSSNALMQECLDDIVIPEFEKGSISGGEKDLFSELSFEQLLEAIVGSNNINKTPASGSVPINVKAASGNNSEHKLPTAVTVGCPSLCTTQIHVVNQSDKVITAPSKEASSKSHFNLQIDDSCSMNTGNLKVNQPKSTEEAVKVVKKRARPGESTRPRPKDRQLIQDRVKELREIVPNGAKCSIDALLDRTIKHMLFLQSVTKYAEKIKQADEPKMIGDESGVVLKDNSSGSSGGGATWAYEVAGQTMVCPIIVEDLTPPGQMLIEMLCEERGFFLEIADIIRGYGLTILKGVMEIRESKIWSRFLVEANRDITRMDIFLSLVQLLQQTNSIRPNEQLTKVMEGGGASTFKNYQQSPISIPVGLADRVQ
ncbi:transcription factor LHW-like [Ananas comosus]|uniref:Transcription factor LHW-like n=1 Tax=Ananas comosus TaxID=4615 RepID=A0A6P5ENS7_ANACO|nr:transcription factor LHW-like [Ananas comosus]